MMKDTQQLEGNCCYIDVAAVERRGEDDEYVDDTSCLPVPNLDLQHLLSIMLFVFVFYCAKRTTKIDIQEDLTDQLVAEQVQTPDEDK